MNTQQLSAKHNKPSGYKKRVPKIEKMPYTPQSKKARSSKRPHHNKSQPPTFPRFTAVPAAYKDKLGLNLSMDV